MPFCASKWIAIKYFERLYQIMFETINLSQIGADRYQKLIFKIILLSPPWRTVLCIEKLYCQQYHRRKMFHPAVRICHKVWNYYCTCKWHWTLHRLKAYNNMNSSLHQPSSIFQRPHQPKKHETKDYKNAHKWRNPFATVVKNSLSQILFLFVHVYFVLIFARNKLNEISLIIDSTYIFIEIDK